MSENQDAQLSTGGDPQPIGDSVGASVLSPEEFVALSGPRCAVLGSPVSHSLSPLIHKAGYRAMGLDLDYYRVEAPEARDIRVIAQAQDPNIRGLSVTMPGKGAALELAGLATKRAEHIGSANTLVPQEDGRWLADNTDVDGLTACLDAVAAELTERDPERGAPFAGRTAVIVGNGGTARPAVAAAAAAGFAEINVVARSERALNLQALTESLGMEFSWTRFDAPELGHMCGQAATLISTVPEDVAAEYVDEFCRAESVIDVIYDPYPTALLAQAKQQGMPFSDGLQMLAGQAEEQFRLFTGQHAPEGLFLAELRQHLALD